jgi:Protein of unknown function (DUF2726)
MSLALTAVVLLTLAALAWHSWSGQVILKTSDDEPNLQAWHASTVRPLTRLELSALAQIKTIAPHCIVLPQVSLSRFIKVKSSLSYSTWFYKVGRRCVDFLICSSAGDVVGVIELHSGAAPAKPASKGVQAKERTLAQANIPVWYFNPDAQGAIDRLHALIYAELDDSVAHTTLGPLWAATEEAPRKAGIEAIELEDYRWNQPWPTEDSRPTAFLDIAEPPTLTERVAQ